MYHRDLKVWQESNDLVKVIHDTMLKFPQNEQYGLSAQLRRAVVSVPSNIAEGCGRDSNKELYHFINVASGSLAEVETRCYIAYSLGCINNMNEIDEKLESVQKLLAGFHKHIKKEIEKNNQIAEEV